MVTQHSVAKHFSAAAESYADLSELQVGIAEGLLKQIPCPCMPRRVLDLGCGTGEMAIGLSQLFPDAKIVAVDIAPGMLEVATERVSKSNIAWHCCDRFEEITTEPYDLVVSSSALQWMQPIPEVVEKVFNAVADGGVFLCSVMLLGTYQELHSVRAEVAPEVRPLLALPDFSEVCESFAAVGFDLEWAEYRRVEQSYGSARSFLERIRKQGFTGGPLSQGYRFLTRGELQRVLAQYQSRYQGVDGRVPATSVFGLFCGRKSSPF